MRALCAAVATRLADEGGESPPAMATEERLEFDAGFLRMVIKHRVVSVVLPVLESMGAPHDMVESLARFRSRQQQVALRLAHDQQRVMELFEERGMRAVSVKGLTLAAQTTGDMTSRGVGDVDVLIDLPDTSAAFRTLEDEGFVAVPGYSPRPDSPLFASASRLQSQAAFGFAGGCVDLHWRLDPVTGGLSWSFEDLWNRREMVNVGGHVTPTLSAADACVFGAANAGRDSWSTLRHVVDQIRLLRLVDAELAYSRAVEARALRRLEIAISVCSHLVPLEGVASRRAGSYGDQMWAWLAADSSPGDRGGARSTIRRFRINLGIYDSRTQAARRLQSHLWPVGAAAQGKLGSLGDDHPWMYMALAPAHVVSRVRTRAVRS